MAISTLWFLWMESCKRIFKKEVISPYSLSKKILYFFNEHNCLSKWNYSEQLVNLRSSSQYYIRSDGSFKSENLLASIGWTINSSDSLISAGATPLQSSSILHTEALAISASLQDAEKVNISNFTLLTDSLSLCNALSNCANLQENLEEIMSQCKEILRARGGIAQWTRRLNISAPNHLAKLARKIAISNYWEDDFPLWLIDINSTDCCNFYY